MDDEAADVGTESDVDKAARDLEFALFYRGEMPKLVGFLIVHGTHPGVAADIAQEAMTEAYRAWDSIDSPRAWVRTVASRKWWRRYELDQVEVPQEEPAGSSTLLTADEAAAIVIRHTFLDMVRDLPLEQRRVMAWTYDGYQPTEIAALFGKEPATVRSILRAARAALRKRYGPAAEERP